MVLAIVVVAGLALGYVGLSVVHVIPEANISAMTIESRALGKSMPAEVWVPPGTDVTAPHDVLILFNGRGGDEWGWFGTVFSVTIDAIATDLAARGLIDPPIIVSAKIDDSYGMDSPPSSEGYSHGAYEQYIIDELIPAIDARFPGTADPARRFIGGLSMGGYAALHATFRHPELFAGVGGVSPAIFQGSLPDRDWMYPTAADRAAQDPLLLAKTAPITGLRIFLGHGDNDYPWIIDAVNVLADRLDARGMTVTPVVVPGDHETSTFHTEAGPMLEALFPAG